jgi:hypothetical protein
MSARRTNQPARGVGLQPPLVLAPVPDPIFWSKHPAPAFAVQHCEIAHRDPKGARLKVSNASLFDEKLVTDLRFCERIDSHAGEYGTPDEVVSNRLKGPQHASHHIPKLDSIRRPPRFFFTFQTE